MRKSYSQAQCQSYRRLKLPGLNDQALSELLMDAPAPRLVGIGQRCALDLLLESHMVKPGRLSREANLDVTQTLAISQLGEGHHAKLLGAGKRLQVTVAAMSLDKACERAPRQEIHRLGKQCFARPSGRCGRSDKFGSLAAQIGK